MSSPLPTPENLAALLQQLGAAPSKGSWWRRKSKVRPALTDSELVTENERLKLKQRKVLALVAGMAALFQVLCADAVFVTYAWHGMHWRVPAAAIESWLAATVVQVIGVVLVITRSLFPSNKESAA